MSTGSRRLGPYELGPELMARAPAAPLAAVLPLAALLSRFCGQDLTVDAGAAGTLSVHPPTMASSWADALHAPVVAVTGPTVRAALTGAHTVTFEVPAGLVDDAVDAALRMAAIPFVRAAGAQPSTPLSRIPAVGAGATTVTGPAADTSGRPLHHLLDRHVRERPDAVAVADGDAELTYARLAGRAGAFAAVLADHGVRPGDAVALLMPRSADAVVATVAISMAGGTAVPLDPAYPRQRLELMLAHPRMRCAVVHETLREVLPGTTPALVYAAPQSTAPPPGADGPAPVATVMYTSGSTGTPKGVEITHRGVRRLVTDDQSIGFTTTDVVLHYAPATFDASLLEIWGALAAGARLVVAPPGPLSLRELGELITTRKITTLWLTAGVFHQLAEYEPDCFAGVRRLFTGGDVVSVHHVRALLTRWPGLEIVNGYGPTENTTFTTVHRITAPGDLPADHVPIGRPVAGTGVHLLDRYGQPVPPGVPAELWTSGAGLAAGYLGRPDFTAERFVTPGDGPLAGERMYRTGDLARLGADGVLEFLGRLDSQVKINGFRIELTEVEAAVAACPGVRQSCVLVERDPTGGKRLAAHVVTGAEPDRSFVRDLRRRLLERLPPFMVPARFVIADTLPLTANGKIDRVRLLARTEGKTAP